MCEKGAQGWHGQDTWPFGIPLLHLLGSVARVCGSGVGNVAASSQVAAAASDAADGSSERVVSRRARQFPRAGKKCVPCCSPKHLNLHQDRA